MKLERIAEDYDPSTPEKDFDWWLIHFDYLEVQKFLIGTNVLELGCGRGILTEKLAHHCKRLTVVDGSTTNIEATRLRLGSRSHVRFRHSLWQEFNYPRRGLSDVIFSMGLEHLTKAQGVRLLSRVRDWLASGGRLHLIVPNANSIHRRLALHMGLVADVHELGERDRRFGHRRVFDRDALVREVRRAGYIPVHTEGIFLKLLTNDMMISLDRRIIEGLYGLGSEFPDQCAHLYLVCERSS